MTTIAHALLAPSRRTRLFPLLLLVAIVLALLLIAFHIAVGTLDLTPMEVVQAFFDQAQDPLQRQIVWDFRLPRAIIALTAGGMLGIAGALLQIVSRNPLAEPGLMGVTSGAVLAIVAWIVLGARLFAIPMSGDAGTWLPLIGVIGGMASGTLTYLLSWRGGSDPVRLVLVGVLVGGLASAFTSLLLLGGGEWQIARVIRWIVGSTSDRIWVHWATLWPYAATGIPLALLSAGTANALQLGDGVARGISQRVEGARLWLLFVAAILTAGAVSVVGAIGFIGLIGPHLARSIVGNDARRLLPMSGILSGLLLVGSDIIARTVELGWLTAAANLGATASTGLPVGAITALLGVPFFIYLLLRRDGVAL